MDKEIIKQYLIDSKDKKLENVLPRETSLKSSSKIQAVIGARRTGKTHLLYNRMKELQKEGISKERIIYLNFENPVLDDVSYKEFKNIIELHWSLYPASAKEKTYLFIDEPQVIPNWERAVRSLYDELNAEICITGSSSRLLEKEISASLRGRSLKTLLLPLSFREFLRFKNIDYSQNLSSKKKASIIHYFNEYLKNGAYPEITREKSEEDKLKILKEYFDLTIFKDLIDRYNINNTRLIKTLIDLAVASCSKEFSVSKHYNDLKSRGFKLGKSTMYEYFSNLEDSMFIFSLKKFSYSQKTQDLSVPKIYLGDVGFLSLYFRENYGQRLENAVFLELLRQTSRNPRKSLNYWQSPGGLETDFVISDGKTPQTAIQVSYNISNPATKKREINSLLACMQELNLKKGLILTQYEEGQEKIDGKTIQITPAWKWLLSLPQ
ncbi:MAG: ATP-binding protein [Candidatus Moranbacteria bacterium]|nr:ATP-binding protein [Candidatus Moranbacteria bacterium]